MKRRVARLVSLRLLLDNGRATRCCWMGEIRLALPPGKRQAAATALLTLYSLRYETAPGRLAA